MNTSPKTVIISLSVVAGILVVSLVTIVVYFLLKKPVCNYVIGVTDWKKVEN